MPFAFAEDHIVQIAVVEAIDFLIDAPAVLLDGERSGCEMCKDRTIHFWKSNHDESDLEIANNKWI